MNLYDYLPLPLVNRAAKAAAEQGVSAVGRSRRGFLTWYRRTRGRPAMMPEALQVERDGFVARHMAQLRNEGSGNGWEGEGSRSAPTRRHLALAVWAYSPSPRRLEAWLDREGF
jgi:hypothetical protein